MLLYKKTNQTSHQLPQQIQTNQADKVVIKMKNM